MNTEMERTFLAKFVARHRKDRLLGMLQKPKKREDFKRLLPHGSSVEFETRWICAIPMRAQNADDIYRMLKDRDTPDTCYMISTSPGLDGAEMPLKEALDSVMGKLLGGTIIICDPRSLAFVEGEDYHDRYILHDGTTKTS